MTSTGIQQTFQLAMRHHQEGRLPEAEVIYRQILQTRPDHAGALHHLGQIAGQAGAYGKAVELIGRAIEADDRVAEFHCNLAEAYRATGRLDQAGDSYHRALDLDANQAHAHFGLAGVLSERNRLDEAEDSLHRGLALRPRTAMAYCMLGDIYRRRGRAEKAVEHLQRAVTLEPGLTLAHNNLGSLLQRIGRLDQAVDAYHSAICIDPHQVDLHTNLGHALKELDRLDEAVATYRAALALDEGFAEAHFGLANALRDQGKKSEAAVAYERAIALNPGFTEAYSAYGVLLNELGRSEEAIARFHRALSLEPRHVRSCANLGLALRVEGRGDEADAFFDYDRLVQHRRFDRVAGWDGLDAFNAALAEYIYGRADLMRDRPSVATKGGSQTGNILLDDHPVTRTLLSMMQGLYQDYLETAIAGDTDPYFDAPPASWLIKANAVVLNSNGYQEPHIHPVGYCSGVYYVRIPEPVRTALDSENGYIRFGKAGPGEPPPGGRRVTIKPEAGLMLIFPSYFWHGTIPFESGEDRISVAFDVEPC